MIPMCIVGTAPPGGLAFAPDGREPPLLVARQSRRAVVMPHLEEPGRGDVIAPCVVIEEAAIAVTAQALLVVPPRFEENIAPRGFNVLNRSSRTLGNSWLGTRNSDAFAKMPSKRFSGNFIARKSCWRTSHSE